MGGMHSGWLGARGRSLGCAVALVACAAGIACAAGATPALAGTPYVDGIADQDMGLWSGNYDNGLGTVNTPFPSFFASSWVGSPPSHVRYARFVTAPDAVAQGGLCLQNLVDWLTYVTHLQLIPVLSVWNVPEGGCVNNGKPSTQTYTNDIGQLLAYLDGQGLTAIPYIEAWNEPNSSGVTAPQAAAYWTAADAICATANCTAIAGDLVDNDPDQGRQTFNPGCAANLTYNNHLAPYEVNYVAALGSARPAIWGFHPYFAVNCEQSASVTTFAANLPTPANETWFTEVGAWECVKGQSPPRGVGPQQADADYLVNQLMTSSIAPAHVFWYELAPLVYTQSCSKYADSALYEAQSAPGFLFARPAAATVYGPDPATATTGAASGVSSTTATFNATYTPGGPYEGTWSFQYGTSTAYGSQTPPVTFGPGLAGQAVSATVSGLIPGVPYHYRLVLTDTNGATIAGSDMVMAPVVVSASPTGVPAGGSVTVFFSGISDPSPTDWVGLYQPGAPDDAYLGGFYAGSCTQTPGGPAPASGSCVLVMPITGGSYEVRLYAGAASGLLAIPARIDVRTVAASTANAIAGTPLTVFWAGLPPINSDWVGLYAPGAPPDSFLDWFYAGSCAKSTAVTPAPAGSCAYRMPSTPGTYELRIYADAANDLLATSGSVTAVPPAPVNGVLPVIAGTGGRATAFVADTLSCSTGSWSNEPTRFVYAWARDGAPVAGATSRSYAVRAADRGHALSCSVVASNAGGAGAAARSTRIAVVSRAPDTVLAAARVVGARRSVTVRVRATGAASALRCALVRAGPGIRTAAPRYARCVSPATFAHLAIGSYTLYVRAVGPGGLDATPLTYRFTIR